MRKRLETPNGFCGCQLCLEDVYAISMNQVPAHYIQRGAMILQKPDPDDAALARIVSGAVQQVDDAPNHP